MDLPCRIVCHLDGVEWFAYNRTPAYEALANIIKTFDSDNSSNVAQSEAEDIVGKSL